MLQHDTIPSCRLVGVAFSLIYYIRVLATKWVVLYVGSFKALNRLNNQDQRRGSQMTTTSQQLSSIIISQLRMRNKNQQNNNNNNI